MNRRFFGALGVVAVFTLTVGSCKSDPFADVHGTPAAVVTDFSYLQLPIGGTAAVKASIVDATATPLAVPITFTPCTGDVTVATDTSYHPIPATSARVIVTAVTANPSCVVVGGGGVKDTIQVAVLPQAFAGAFSSATPKGGDTLTISSTSLLKFDTTKVGVIFSGAGSDDTGIVVSKTPDAVKVLVPFGAAGPLTIAGIAVTYVPKLVVTFPTTNTVTQTGDLFATNDTSYATAPTIPLPAAAGTSVKILTDFDADNGPKCAEFGPPGPNTSIGPCVIYKFTLAALEGTLALYLDPERAAREVPVLRMLAEPAAEVRARAERLAAAVGGDVEQTVARVGGGALPLAELESYACAIEEQLAAPLRLGRPPVVGVIRDGRLLLDCRTLTDAEAAEVAEAVRRAR